MHLSFTYREYKIILLLCATIAFASETLHAQCPADPISCIPNTKVNAMPDTMFICERVTSVLLNPQISGGVFSWFRENSVGGFNPASGSGSSSAASSLPGVFVEGNYYLCHQANNLSCYKKFKVVVAKKSLENQLNNEKEFERTDDLFICSGQAKPFFNSTGNTIKYNYSWAPSSLFSGSSNVKNAKFTATYPKGASSVGSFRPQLIIKEKSSGCIIQKSYNGNVYPPPNPDFGDLQFCQNVPSEISARVFILKGYNLRNATLQIGGSPEINLLRNDFLKIPSNQLLPNTLGEVTSTNINGRQLNNANFLIDVATISINTTKVMNNIPITFTMVTDSGCTATISSSYNVGNTFPAPIISQEKSQLISNFEIGNQWYMDGQLLKDSTNQYITPVRDASYTARYINGECTSAMSVPFDFILGAENSLIPNNALQLYPNPANNILHIKTSFLIERVLVYQHNGKVVWESKANEMIDIAGFSEGLYLLEVWDNNDRRVLKKFEKR